MALKARLFDAKGKDKEVDLADSSFKLQQQQLLWIDTDRDEADLALADNALGWPGHLADLKEIGERPRVVEAVENARELLVGCFDIVMTRTAQRTNDVMRVLTVVSSVLLPSVVIAGVMGMNFKAEIFDDPFNFYLVIAAMVLLAITILAFGRWRRWI